MLDEEYEGTVSKEEFLNGMFRLVFGDEFQRNCCVMLTIAQVKKEIKDGLKQAVEELISSSRNGNVMEASNGSPAGQVLKQGLQQAAAPHLPMFSAAGSDWHPALRLNSGHADMAINVELSCAYTALCKQLDAAVQSAREMQTIPLVRRDDTDGLSCGGVHYASAAKSGGTAMSQMPPPLQPRPVHDMDAAPEPKVSLVSRAGSRPHDALTAHQSPCGKTSPASSGMNFPI